MIKMRLLRRFSQGKIRIFDIQSQNIHQNLALENYLFNHDQLKYPTLLLWRNDKTIVIGKHQNPWKECYLDRIERDGVVLARRKSGGGAVYQDLGNTCFSFLTPIFEENVAPLDTRKKNNGIILAALRTLGIEGTVSGRNDLEVNGKKFSGSAYELDLGGKKTQKKALHHGTILLNVNFESLKDYLNPSKPKLKSKGVDSVVSRVINLCELNPSLDHEKVGIALKEEFKRAHPDSEVVQETVLNPFDYNPIVKQTYDKWTDPKWVLGETPEFTNHFETRFNWGTIEFYFQVNEGVISIAKIYSDSLVPDLIDELSAELNSKHYHYSKKGIMELSDIMMFKQDASNKPNVGIINDIKDFLISNL